jgi:hypothetical protein
MSAAGSALPLLTDMLTDTTPRTGQGNPILIAIPMCIFDTGTPISRMPIISISIEYRTVRLNDRVKGTAKAKMDCCRTGESEGGPNEETAASIGRSRPCA